LFNKVLSIESMAFTREPAGQIFTNIRGGVYQNDASFLATLRALLHKRIGEDHITLSFSSFPCSSSFASVSATELIKSAVDIGDTDVIRVISLNGNTNNIQVVLDKFDTIHQINDGFHSRADITAYLKEMAAVRVYVNERQKYTIILVANLNIRVYHLLQCMVPNYCPWFFDANRKLTAKEIELSRAAARTNPADYERLIQELSEEVDFRSYLIKTMVGDFERRSLSAMIDRERDINRSIYAEIEENVRRYNEFMRRINESNLKILGMETALNAVGDHSELMDFFTSNKCLVPFSGDDEGFSFGVQTYLTNFDPDAYQAISGNRNSYIYDCNSVYPELNDTNNRKKLLDAIFSDDPLIRVKMCGYYRIMSYGEVSTRSHFNYPTDFARYIRNPHLHYHSCLGGHQSVIRQCLQDHDVIGAVSQCICSAGSVNVNEGISAKYFIEELMNATEAVVELPDGSCVTPIGALKWLNDQEEAKKNEQKEEA